MKALLRIASESIQKIKRNVSGQNPLTTTTTTQGVMILTPVLAPGPPQNHPQEALKPLGDPAASIFIDFDGFWKSVFLADVLPDQFFFKKLPFFTA